MKFVDLFAGIGGFRLGMEMAGHECVGYVEIDKFARQSYLAIHNTEGEYYADDIRSVQPRDLPEADCYTAGFPCQSFSVAGKRGGFSDTRGTLFFEIMRLAKERKPKYLFLENVAGLLSHDGERTFGTILQALYELGYDAEWQVLNSKDFGVPQNRERVFIIGHLGGGSGGKVFPIRRTNEIIIKRHQGDVGGKGYNSQQDRVYDPDGLMGCDPATRTENKVNIFVKPCLTPDRKEKRQNGRRFKDDGDPMFTLTAQDIHGIAVKGDLFSRNNPQRQYGFDRDNSFCLRTAVTHGVAVVDRKGTLKEKATKDQVASCLTAGAHSGDNHSDMDLLSDGYRIRRLTPLECWRLQGFPDEAFYNAQQAGVSNSQLYKQAGNSVTVNVIHEIAKKIGGMG